MIEKYFEDESVIDKYSDSLCVHFVCHHKSQE